MLILVRRRGWDSQTRLPDPDVAEFGSAEEGLWRPDVEGAAEDQVSEQVSVSDLLLEPVQGDLRYVRPDLLHLGHAAQARQVRPTRP